MTTEQLAALRRQAAHEHFRAAMRQLIEQAYAQGIVLTAETEPVEPLRMGGYCVVVQSREARNPS